MAYEITDSTPKRSIRVLGFAVNVPAPFAEGHPLTATEAAVLNQTYAENLRNNVSAQVKKMQDDAETADPTETDVQAMFDSYAAEYEFGVRRSGGGAGLTPVQRRVRKIASEQLRMALKAQQLTKKDIGDEKYDELLDQVIAANPQLEKEAEKQLAAESKAASSLDLTGLSVE